MGLDTKVIKEYQKDIEKRVDELGLTKDKITFYTADTEDIAVVASYGHKERHAHWSFGADYLKLREMEKSGQMHIHEIVITTSPVKAYLHDKNSDVEDKLVINHVYGHVDFHLNNIMYAKVDLEKVLDTARENQIMIERYRNKFGNQSVEKLLDACLTVAPYSDGMEKFLKPNPSNLMTFLMENAPLEKWEKDVLNSVKEETLNLTPTAKVKIMEEGWATYIQEKLSFFPEIISDAEVHEFTDMHGKITRMSGGPQFPYAMGYRIWKDIEEKFGFEECKKIRDSNDDITFVTSYLSQDIVDKEIKQYQPIQDPNTGQTTGYERVYIPVEQIRDSLVSQLINAEPKLITEKNDETGDLEIFHVFEKEKVLDEEIVEGFMEQISHLWKGNVTLETYDKDDFNITYTFCPHIKIGEKLKKQTHKQKRGLGNVKLIL